MLISQNRVFLKKNEAVCVCVNMREFITPQVSIAWYNIFT